VHLHLSQARVFWFKRIQFRGPGGTSGSTLHLLVILLISLKWKEFWTRK
jgi:hypothetical protein